MPLGDIIQLWQSRLLLALLRLYLGLRSASPDALHFDSRTPIAAQMLKARSILKTVTRRLQEASATLYPKTAKLVLRGICAPN